MVHAESRIRGLKNGWRSRTVHNRADVIVPTVPHGSLIIMSMISRVRYVDRHQAGRVDRSAGGRFVIFP